VFGEHGGLSAAEVEALEKEGVLKSEPLPEGVKTIAII